MPGGALHYVQMSVLHVLIMLRSNISTLSLKFLKSMFPCTFPHILSPTTSPHIPLILFPDSALALFQILSLTTPSDGPPPTFGCSTSYLLQMFHSSHFRCLPFLHRRPDNYDPCPSSRNLPESKHPFNMLHHELHAMHTCNA